MIPILILAGLVTGRWWRITIPVAAIGWPVVLAATGVTTDAADLAAGAALAAANTTVGVLVYLAVARLWMAIRGHSRADR